MGLDRRRCIYMDKNDFMQRLQRNTHQYNLLTIIVIMIDF